MPRVVALWLCSTLACAPLRPLTPQVLVTPASAMPYATFWADETACRRVALLETTAPRQPAQTVLVPAVSALLLFVLGVLLGLATGHLGPGITLGTGAAVWVGETLGSERSDRARQARQRQYDFAYVQCMAAAGHRTPATWWLLP